MSVKLATVEMAVMGVVVGVLGAASAVEASFCEMLPLKP